MHLTKGFRKFLWISAFLMFVVIVIIRENSAPPSMNDEEFENKIRTYQLNKDKIIDKAVQNDISYMISSSIGDLKKYGYIPKDKPVDKRTLEKAFWEYVANGMGPKKK